MQTSARGIEFIKANEGTKWNKAHDRLVAYDDGYGYLTIGYGHHDSKVKLGDSLTPAEADELLKQDLFTREVALTKALVDAEIVVSQNQFDALMDFVFNIKGGVERLLGTTLWKKLKAGDIKATADEFLRWCFVNGKESRGLKARRERERDLFLTLY